MEWIWKHIKKFFSDMALVFRQEWKLMLHDPGLLVFFIALPLAYPVVYTLIYNPEVVRQIPVAVVDDCRSEASREFVTKASAAPAVQIYGYAANINDAKQLWAEQKIYAILHIPSDYERKIYTNQQARVEMYCDMSLLLRYRSLLSAMTSLQLEMAQEITQVKVDMLGAESLGLGGLPIKQESEFLGDSQQGFASFVIPGIVVLILQQSLILGAALMGGTTRERRRKHGGSDPKSVESAGALASVWGKTLAYVIFYIPSTIYILHFIPEMFSLPHHGNPVDYLLFIFPMLVASAFLGQFAVLLIREREYVFLVVVFTSVIFLFLSGLTWPRYAMAPIWRAVGDIVPATWGVEGFIRINSNAATLAQNAHAYVMLWVLVGAYMVLAAIAHKWLIRNGK